MEKCDGDLESAFNKKNEKFIENPLTLIEIHSIYLNIVTAMECLH
jgi:hypothetical protein